MLTLLHPSSSIRDIVLSLSMSLGYSAAILWREANARQGCAAPRRPTRARTYVEVDLVDLVDDLQVPGQERLQQVDGPALQSFGQDRVVCVGEGAPGEVPGLWRRDN